MSILGWKKYSYSFLYSLFTAISLVVIEKTTTIDTATSLFVCSLLATIFFNMVNYRDLRIVYQELYQHKLVWAYTSIAILIVWWATFYATKTIGSMQFIFAYFIIRAMIGNFFLIYKEFTERWAELICLIGLTVILIFLFFENTKDIQTVIGFIIACLGGTAGYLYGKVSHVLHEKTKMTASQILAVRFFLLILVSAYFIKYNTLFVTMTSHWLQLTVITLFSFIIPLYMNQSGIHAIGPNLHVIITALTPLIVVIMTLFLSPHNVIISPIIIALLISIFISIKPMILLLKGK